MRLEMVDGEERLAGRQRHALAGHQADQHAADQARAGRRGDAVELRPRLRPAVRERASDQPVDDLDMGARGDLRHDAAIGRVGGDLAHHLVGENLARAVGAQPHHRRRGLVAGGFDSQDPHSAAVYTLGARCTAPNERAKAGEPRAETAVGEAVALMRARDEAERSAAKLARAASRSRSRR